MGLMTSTIFSFCLLSDGCFTETHQSQVLALFPLPAQGTGKKFLGEVLRSKWQIFHFQGLLRSLPPGCTSVTGCSPCIPSDPCQFLLIPWTWQKWQQPKRQRLRGGCSPIPNESAATPQLPKTAASSSSLIAVTCPKTLILFLRPPFWTKLRLSEILVFFWGKKWMIFHLP